MDTRKFQGLRVTHVKERLTSYRLQLNDNSIIDIPRIELGGFVPQKGMFVRYRFYRGLILQKIEFDGKTVVNRTPAEIMNLLCRVDAKLEEDVRRQQRACENEDLVFDGLSEIMKQRIFLVQSIGQHPEIGGFSRDALDYEIARCAMAEDLGRLGKGYLEKFRTLSLQSQQAVLMGDIDKELIEDIIPLAEAFAQDLATGVEDPRHSEVMKTWSCIFDFSPENFERFREHYFKHLSEKTE